MEGLFRYVPEVISKDHSHLIQFIVLVLYMKTCKVYLLRLGNNTFTFFIMCLKIFLKNGDPHVVSSCIHIFNCSVVHCF